MNKKIPRTKKPRPKITFICPSCQTTFSLHTTAPFAKCPICKNICQDSTLMITEEGRLEKV